MKNLLLLLALIVLNVSPILCKTTLVYGKILSDDEGQGIPGASIRIVGTMQGTYSASGGRFRLPLPKGHKKLLVKSMGYFSAEVTVNNPGDSLFIRLKPSPVSMKFVKVTADISPEQIIERAIKRKQENMAKIKTISAELYSKVTLGLGGSMAAMISGNTLTMATEAGEEADTTNPNTFFIMETFSDVFNDYENERYHSEITRRKQTANMAPDDNMIALSKFINFYDERIELINSNFVSPISTDALSYYKFTLTGRTMLDDKYVYVLSVEPDTRVYPVFTGTIKILEGSYNLLEVDVRPADRAAISFVDSLHISQKFEPVGPEMWHPAYMKTEGKLELEAVKGMLEITADFDAVAIMNKIEPNKEMPDSVVNIFKINDSPHHFTSVSAAADTNDLEFWKQNSLREITPLELEQYTRIDSAVAKDSAEVYKRSALNYGPMLSFNRAASIVPGAYISYDFGLFSSELDISYSTGLKEVLPELEFEKSILLSPRKTLKLSAKGGRRLAHDFTGDNFMPFLNTITAAALHHDNYDWWLEDYMTVTVGLARSMRWNINAYYNYADQQSIKKTTDRSIFSDRTMRINPEIEEGRYHTLGFSAALTDYKLLGITTNSKLIANFTGKEEKGTLKRFRSLFGYLDLDIPLIETGYKPISARLCAEGGLADPETPSQFLFVQNSSLKIFNKFRSFLTAPPAKYGGNEYFAFHGQLNLTDIWWRWLGLPTYEGRGIDLILAGSAAKYFGSSANFYKPVTNDYYKEYGITLERIPTFISNVAYLGLHLRWGEGQYAQNRFGWGLSVTLPF